VQELESAMEELEKNQRKADELAARVNTTHEYVNLAF
jgi:hypothetical protein